MEISHSNHREHPDASVTTAVLLAAGTGSRLQPLTDDAPKCLTEINGIPLLERQVRCLHQLGFKRLVVVVGYLEQHIRDFLEAWTGDLRIDYVVSPHYRTTNNIYSLWLARQEVREPFLLLECDLVFEPFLLDDMLLTNKMAVARVQPWMMGSTVSLDPFQRITDFRVGHSEVPDDSRYKTVNIYSLSLPSWRRVVRRLDQRILAGKVNDYYESVFAEMVADGSLSFEPVFFDDGRWYEVDTLADLQEAERLFPKHPDWIFHRRDLAKSEIQTLHRTFQSRISPVTSVGADRGLQREKTDENDPYEKHDRS
jgi:NDP-sugar pyrophosphorylase family protein